MAEELKILKERGRSLVLTVTGMRVGSPGAVSHLRATLGSGVLVNLPLPRGPAVPEGKAPRPPKKGGGTLRKYTERSSLTELIRHSIKQLQDGRRGRPPARALVPGTVKRQESIRAGKKWKTKTTTVPVQSQDWRYSWTVEEIAGAAPAPNTEE